MLLQMAIVYALSLLCEIRCENIHNLATDSSASGHSNVQLLGNSAVTSLLTPVSYTHLTLPTTGSLCRSRWSPYH